MIEIMRKIQYNCAMKPALWKRILIALPLSALAFAGVFRLAQDSGEWSTAAISEPTAPPAVTTVPVPTPEPAETPAVTPEPAPAATPAATPTAIPSTAPEPSPTPAPLPEAPLGLEKETVTTVGGKEVSVKITTAPDVTISTSCSQGISTWYDPGMLYIYPANAGTVTVTASGEAYEPVSKTIQVSWAEPAAPLPDAPLILEKDTVTTVGGKEVSVKITTAPDVTITASGSPGITTWYDPGILYIYPANAGTVTVTASGKAYVSVSKVIQVSWAEPEPEPVPTPTPETGSANTGYTSDDDSTLYVPNISRNDDMSFWFRSCMVDMKDQFFDTAANYGVDPYLALAISDQETGYGSSYAACEQNNYGGLIGPQGVITFDTPQDGLNALMNTLRNYKNAGKRTIAEIASWYCGGNTHWIERITTIYNSFHR